MIELKFTITGDDKLKRRLNKLSTSIKKDVVKWSLFGAGGYMLNKFTKIFQSKDNGRWANVNPLYFALRKSIGSAVSTFEELEAKAQRAYPLIDTGTLRNSLKTVSSSIGIRTGTTMKGSINKIVDNTIFVGSSLDYAKKLQVGGIYDFDFDQEKVNRLKRNVKYPLFFRLYKYFSEKKSVFIQARPFVVMPDDADKAKMISVVRKVIKYFIGGKNGQ